MRLEGGSSRKASSSIAHLNISMLRDVSFVVVFFFLMSVWGWMLPGAESCCLSHGRPKPGGLKLSNLCPNLLPTQEIAVHTLFLPQTTAGHEFLPHCQQLTCARPLPIKGGHPRCSPSKMFHCGSVD